MCGIVGYVGMRSAQQVHQNVHGNGLQNGTHLKGAGAGGQGHGNGNAVGNKAHHVV